MSEEVAKVTQDGSRLILTISASSLNEFQLCPRKYFYTREYEPVAVLRSESLDLGSAGHIACETYYNSLMKNEGSHDERVIRALESAKVFGVEHTSLSIEKIEGLLEHLRGYFEYRKGEEITVHAVEAPFSKILFEDAKYVFLLEGKMDLIADLSARKRIVDHKIVASNRETSPLSNQNLAYVYATGIRDVVINKVGMQKTLKPHEKYHREMFTYEPSQIAEWYHSTVSHWMNLLVHYMEEERDSKSEERSSSWPMNATSCDKYSGCPFLKFVCSSLPETRDSKLATFYKKREARNLFGEVKAVE